MDNKTLSDFILCMCAICFMMGNPRTRTNRIFFLVDPEGKNDPAGLPETHFKKSVPLGHFMIMWLQPNSVLKVLLMTIS